MRFLLRVIALAIVGCNFNEVKTPPQETCVPLPMPPQDAGTRGSTLVTYAIDQIFFGETTNGTAGTTWKAFGFDLDALVSDAKSTNVCEQQPGGHSSHQIDGKCGKDNSFGANIVPIFQSAASVPNPSVILSDAIRIGTFGFQIRVAGLDLATTSQSSVGLSVDTFTGSTFDPKGAIPTFSPTEDWPVRSDLHPDPNAGDVFPTAYINEGMLVATGGDVRMTFILRGARADLKIHHAILAMDVRGDVARNGTLAGVFDAEELIDAALPFAQELGKGFCGSAFDGIAQSMRTKSDILTDGTNVPGKTCNGISTGIGFTARRIANPKRTAPPSPRANLCLQDAGADASSDAPSD